MARLNARQKRARKRLLAIHALGVHRNPPMVATSGPMRSSQKQHLLSTLTYTMVRSKMSRGINLDSEGVKGRKTPNGKIKRKTAKPFSVDWKGKGEGGNSR